MPRQVKTRRVKVTIVMGRADFIMGMRDAAQGKPIRDHWECQHKRWRRKRAMGL